MDINLFKNIIDAAEGNIEFLSLASRGEPLVSKAINEMLIYTEGKFLNLKLNTNASLLTEEKIHSILSGGVKTVVFSADAADEKLYSELRVNGNLKTVLKNIELAIAGLKYGLKGEIIVNNKTYNGYMAYQGLENDEIADVMNYILNQWGNSSKNFVTTLQVDEINKSILEK